MNKIKIFASLLIYFTLFSNSNFAQDTLETELTEESLGKLPNIGISIGLLNYKGDVGNIDKIGALNHLSLGYQMSFSYVIWNTLGIELFGTYANLEQSQTSVNLVHNFKTLLLNGGLNASFHFDNGFLLPKNTKIAPFIFSGISLVNFYPYGDFKNSKDEKYYYWSDGSIQNIEERAINADQAVEISRDFDYETSYRGLNGGFPLFALVYSAGLGSEFKVNKWLSAEMRISYSFSNTDNLDGITIDSKNDGYYTGSFGININPNKIKKSEKKNKSESIAIDFKEMLKLDTDGDGVPDLNDKCSGTPPKTQVNALGCPVKPLPDSLANKTAEQLADSLVSLRKELCIMYPSLCTSEDTDPINGIQRTDKESKNERVTRPIEFIVSVVDKNKDGKLELGELYNAIELYLEGNIDLTLSELKKLIDSFFD